MPQRIESSDAAEAVVSGGGSASQTGVTVAGE